MTDETVPHPSEPPLVAPLAATTLVYDYQSQTGQPPSGKAYQAVGSPNQISFNYTDNGSTNRTSFFNALLPGGTISGAGMTWLIEAVTLRGSNALIMVTPNLQGSPFGVTSFVFTPPAPSEILPTFPAFTLPSPPVASGQPPPPAFPPPSAVPVGPLAVPEPVVPAAVPPSTAGFPLIKYGTGGSATVPPANGYFTKFTVTPYTGFPNVPPAGVPIVFSNTFNGAVVNAGQNPPWKWNPPPSTTTVAQITINGYAPVWSGLSDFSVTAAAEDPDAGAIHQRNSRPPKRRGRSVFPNSDANSEH